MFALLLMTISFFTTKTVFAQETTSSIVINLQNNVGGDISGETWRLHYGIDATGAIAQVGSGDAILNNMLVGDYFLETTSNLGDFESVSITPSNSQALWADSTITFNVLYTFKPGTLVIDLQDSANANVTGEAWTLHSGTSASGTVVQSSTGDAILNNMTIGSYFLETTSNTGNYKTIVVTSENPQTLKAGGTLTFSVLYTLQPTTGSITIDLQDSAGADVTNETWKLYSGTSASGTLLQAGTGDVFIKSRAPGSYFLETSSNNEDFQSVQATSANPQTLKAGSNITFSVLYTLKPQRGTVVIDLQNNAGLDLANEAWKLHSGTSATGPVVRTGGGDASVPNLPVGPYFLETTSNNGFFENIKVMPANPQTLMEGGTITFKVTYDLGSKSISEKGKISRIFAKRRREIFRNHHEGQKACKLISVGDRSDCLKTNAEKKNTALRAVQTEMKAAMMSLENK